MAIGLVRANSIFGIEEEVTEGTYVAPQSSSKYCQLLEGYEMKPSRERIDRGLVTSAPGPEAPRLGMKMVEGSWPCELRASGVEGGEPDFDSLLKGALGARRQNTTRVTSKNDTHTSTVIKIEDADISKFAVGDTVLVMRSGMHELRPISAVDTTGGAATITLAFALTNGVPPASVQIAKFTTYYTAATGHPSLSLSEYIANEVRKAAIGAKVTSMALQNFAPGKVASLAFGFSGINYSRVDGAAPHTPAYDTGVPPIILNACIWRDGVQVQCTNLGLNLTNELGPISSTCSANGKTGQRVKGREILGTFNPYTDDTSVDHFDDWNAGTLFSLFAYAYTPSSTSGEIELGSVVALWIPQAMALEFNDADIEGINAEEMPFLATRGANGTLEEAYLTMI